MTRATSSQWTSWISAVVLFFALTLLGAAAGVLVATRIVGTSGMGWDQLADTLGGLIAGSVLGAVASIGAARTLGSAHRFWMAGAAVIACAGAVAYLQATEPRVRTGRVAPIAAPPAERLLAAYRDAAECSPSSP